MKHGTAVSLSLLLLTGCAGRPAEFPCQPNNNTLHVADHSVLGYPSDSLDDSISVIGCYDGKRISLHQMILPGNIPRIELQSIAADGTKEFFKSAQGNTRRLESYTIRSPSLGWLQKPPRHTSGPEFQRAHAFYSDVLEEAHTLAQKNLQDIGNY